jgi:hypothetical protein
MTADQIVEKSTADDARKVALPTTAKRFSPTDVMLSRTGTAR